MRRFTLFRAHQTVMHAAVLMSALSDEKFRAPSVQFYASLFSHFLGLHALGMEAEIQTVQLNRTFEEMVKRGMCTSTRTGGKREYELTAEGLYHFLLGLTETDHLLDLGEISFTRFILMHYKEFITDKIKSKKSDFDIDEQKLQVNYFLQKQLHFVSEAFRDTQARMDQYVEYENFVESNKGSADSWSSLTKEFSKRFVYPLAHRKPLNALINSLPILYQRYELESGFKNRRLDFLNYLVEILIHKRHFIEGLMEPKALP